MRITVEEDAEQRREDREMRRGASWYHNPETMRPDKNQMGEKPAIDRPNFGMPKYRSPADQDYDTDRLEQDMPKEKRKRLAVAIMKKKLRKK